MTTLAQLHDCHSCNDERSIAQKKREKEIRWSRGRKLKVLWDTRWNGREHVFYCPREEICPADGLESHKNGLNNAKPLEKEKQHH